MATHSSAFMLNCGNLTFAASLERFSSLARAKLLKNMQKLLYVRKCVLISTSHACIRAYIHCDVNITTLLRCYGSSLLPTRELLVQNRNTALWKIIPTYFTGTAWEIWKNYRVEVTSLRCNYIHNVILFHDLYDHS